MKIKKTAFMICAIFALTLTSCENRESESDNSEYATQNRLSAAEYSIYINKQITVFTTQVLTRINACQNATYGKVSDNELEMANGSLEILIDTYTETSSIYPSENSDSKHELVLTAMKTTINHFENYIKAIANKSDISGCIKDFENDFNDLTGLATLYYQ